MLKNPLPKARIPLNTPRRWPVVVVMLLVVALGTWHLKHQPDVKSPILPAAMIKMEPHIELQFQDVTMQGRDKGTVRWRITAKQVSASQNQQYIYFEKEPRGSFYNLKDWNPKDGAPPKNKSVEWSADRAEYDTLMDEMRITGTASFLTEDHDHLATDQVLYRARRHQVLMTKPVELRTHDKLVVRAQEATADTQMEQIELSGNVELVSPLSGQEKL